MPNYQNIEEIDALIAAQESVIADKTTGAACSLATCNDAITVAKATIDTLKAEKALFAKPFEGKSFSLKIDAKDMPSLVCTDRTVASAITATGKKSIVVDGATVTAAGSSTTVVFPGTVVADVVAGLKTFATGSAVVVTVAEAEAALGKLTAEKTALEAKITAQTTTIGAFKVEPEPDPEPETELFTGEVTSVEDGLQTTVTFVPKSGVTVDIDWGDGNTDTGAGSPAVHTYAAADVYEVKVTGTNGTITDQRTLEITVEVIIPPVAPTFTGTAEENGGNVTIAGTMVGTLPITVTVGYTDSTSNPQTHEFTITTEVGRTISEVFAASLAGGSTITLAATNATGTDNKSAVMGMSGDGVKTFA